MNVFAYGTLMYPEVWQAVVGQPCATVRGRLAGYAIYRIRDAVFPGIIAAEDGHAVPGVVHLDVDDTALLRLDRFEDKFYRREIVTVDCDDGAAREAYVYVVPEENQRVLTEEPWIAEDFIARGGLDHFVSRFAGFSRVADMP